MPCNSGQIIYSVHWYEGNPILLTFTIHSYSVYIGLNIYQNTQFRPHSIFHVFHEKQESFETPRNRNMWGLLKWPCGQARGTITFLTSCQVDMLSFRFSGMVFFFSFIFLGNHLEQRFSHQVQKYPQIWTPCVRLKAARLPRDARCFAGFGGGSFESPPGSLHF